MIVMPIAGEATRFYCESLTLECINTQCGRTRPNGSFERTLWNRRHKPELREGMRCPTCGTGLLKIRWHLVDVADFQCVGSCSCEHFEMGLRWKLRARTWQEQFLIAEEDTSEYRCSHLRRVRNYCLNMNLRSHEQARTGGRDEEEAA